MTAALTELGNGGQVITAAECFTGTPGLPGTGIAMLPADGAWDSANETAVVSLPPLPPGRQTVYVRGRDAGGHWGSLGVAWGGRAAAGVPADGGA